MGFFYGGNIAGAVVGCLLAGFYLLRVYDVGVATYCAAGINVVVAGFALFLAAAGGRHEPQAAPAAEEDAERAPGRRASTWRSRYRGRRRWAPRSSGLACSR